MVIDPARPRTNALLLSVSFAHDRAVRFVGLSPAHTSEASKRARPRSSRVPDRSYRDHCNNESRR